MKWNYHELFLIKKGEMTMRIKEVSERVGISDHTLRYYEKVGLLHTIQKNSSGIREYTEKDVSRIEFIKCMCEADISIEKLSEYIKLYDSDEDTFAARRKLLLEEYKAMQERYMKLEIGMQTLEKKAELLDANILDKKLMNTKRGSL